MQALLEFARFAVFKLYRMFGTDFATLLSNSHSATVLYNTGTFLSLLSGLRFPKNIVGIEGYSEYLSMNIPNGLFPSPGAKEIVLSPFSVASGSCSFLFAKTTLN